MGRRNRHNPVPADPARPTQLRLRAIACEVLYRELCLLAANSPNIIDLEFMPKGLHDLGPDGMRRKLQERIDAVDPKIYDGVVLGYGLCSNGTAGLVARNLPLVIPRAHDCITLFLGSKEAYQAEFEKHPGTYFRTTGWSEREFCFQQSESIPQRLGTDKTYEEYVAQYGRENADFIRDMLNSWQRHYDRMVFIDMGIATFLPYAEQAEREAIQRGWSFERIQGSLALLEALLDGPWLEDQFLVVKPGQQIVTSNDGNIIEARPRSSGMPRERSASS